MEWVLLLLVILVLALAGREHYLGLQAKNQEFIKVKLSDKELRQKLDGNFGILWTSVDGEGNFSNHQRRTGQGVGPVISVQSEHLANGITKVDVWMSHWSTRMGMIVHGTAAHRVKTRVLRTLASHSVD